jgi:hypothetical protein
MDDSDKPRILCSIHGRCLWNGGVLCVRVLGGCGKIWQVFDCYHPLFKHFQGDCDCGAEISPHSGPLIAICPLCFLTLKPGMELN